MPERSRQNATSPMAREAGLARRRSGGGIEAIIPSGGFQPADEEGHRAYAPGEHRAGDSGGASLRGLEGADVEEMVQPFDEDAALDRIQAGHRGRGPRGYRRSDERVREDVCERLAEDRYVDASEIQVAVQAGEVTLSGTVGNRSTRRRAEDIAESVQGVSYVQNDLRVRQPFYSPADREVPVETNLGKEGALPTGAGSDASSTSDAGTAGPGAKGAGTGGAA